MNTQTAQPTEHTDVEQKMRCAKMMGVVLSVGTLGNVISAAAAIQRFDGSSQSIVIATLLCASSTAMFVGASIQFIELGKLKQRLEARRIQEESIRPTKNFRL